MNFLFLDPTEEERSDVFRKICSNRLLDEGMSHGAVMCQLTERYVERLGEYQRRVIHIDVDIMCEWINSIADDAIDRLTPEAIEAVINRHVLWAPQTEILIKHVACIVSKKLDLSAVSDDVIAGVHRLYGATAKRIRVTQDA